VVDKGFRDGAKGRTGIGRGYGELGIEGGEEAFQEAIGLLQARDTGQAHFSHQAVLKGLPEALNATLGLGRTGEDELNSQVLGQAPKLSGIRLSGQFLLQGEALVVVSEDPVAVGVQSERDAVVAEDVLEEQEVAGPVLAELKPCGHDLACGVVYGADEDEHRTPIF